MGRGARSRAREARGERGLVRLAYTELYSAVTPGAESAYRDAAVSDSGAPRLAGWLFAAAVREASERELAGYVVVDSPRRAIQTLQTTGGNSVIEVTVSKATALARSREHVEQLREIAPRAAAGDAADADAKCRQMVESYFSERSILEGVDVETVRAPDRPSDRAITWAWTAAIKAAKRGDVATA